MELDIYCLPRTLAVEAENMDFVCFIFFSGDVPRTKVIFWDDVFLFTFNLEISYLVSCQFVGVL
jgi:hypothetical protein